MWWGGECSIFVSLAPVDRQHHKSMYHTSQKKSQKRAFALGRRWHIIAEKPWKIYLPSMKWDFYLESYNIDHMNSSSYSSELKYLFHSISLLLKLSLCSSVFSGTVAPLGSYRFFSLVLCRFSQPWQVASRQTWQMWHMLSLVKWIWAPCLLPLTTSYNGLECQYAIINYGIDFISLNVRLTCVMLSSYCLTT